MKNVYLEKSEKIALFIDGANLYFTTKALGFDIDYRKLLQFFQNRSRLIRAFYYTALFEDNEYSPIRPLVDWLDYNGYTMVTKPAKEYTDYQGRRKIKGNMDMELAIDMMEISPYLDHAVLFSGDGDFKSLLQSVQKRGLKVTVVSTMKTQPAMIADELRRQADQFIDLTDIAEEISRSYGSDPYGAPRQTPNVVPRVLPKVVGEAKARDQDMLENNGEDGDFDGDEEFGDYPEDDRLDPYNEAKLERVRR